MHEDIITKKTEREWKLWKPYRTTCTFVLWIRNVNFILASTVHDGWRCTVSDYDIIISLVLVDLEPNSYWRHCLRPCMCSRSVASKQNHCMWWSKPNPILLMDDWTRSIWKQGAKELRWHPCCEWKHGFWIHSPMKRSSYRICPPYQVSTLYVIISLLKLWSYTIKLLVETCMSKVLQNIYPLSSSWTQLKNMVAALHSSKMGKTMSFQYEGVKLGWEIIRGINVQTRSSKGKRRSPTSSSRTKSLTTIESSGQYHNTLARLNVKPAKIMQVSYV